MAIVDHMVGLFSGLRHFSGHQALCEGKVVLAITVLQTRYVPEA